MTTPDIPTQTSTARPIWQSTARPPSEDDGGDARPARAGSLPPRFLLWASAAASLAAISLAGWLYPLVRPEPFEDPPPPFSLAWWIYAPADPGIADLDMVPVGQFGGYLPRDVARRIRASPSFLIENIADEFIEPTGREIAISLYGQRPVNTTPASIFYSGDAGATWTKLDNSAGSCNGPGQALKVQGFNRGGERIEVKATCFPTPATAGPDQVASATTAVLLGRDLQSGVWLKNSGRPAEASGTAPQAGDSATIASIQLSSNSVTQANGQLILDAPFTIIRPFAQDRVLLASPNVLTIMTIPAGPSTAPLQVSFSSVINLPRESDPRPALRAIRVSGDLRLIAVAQEVARDNGALVSHDGGKNWSRLAYAASSPPWVVFVALPLALVAGTAAVRQFIRTPSGEPSIANEAATDRPIGLDDVDRLQFGRIANGLLMFIRNPQTEPPVTIGVSGAWGSGKTSLMTILRDMLHEYDARPVWFNAWHHQKEEHLLAALLENIRRQAIPSIGTWAGVFFRLRLLRRRWVGRLGIFIVSLAAVLFIIASYLSLSDERTKELRASVLQVYRTTLPKQAKEHATKEVEASQQEKDKGDWLLALGTLLPTGLSVPLLVFGIIKNLQPFPRAKPEQLLRADGKKKTDLASKLSFRYRFQREFSETAEALRTPTSPGLIVFVDDLDRCRGQNVVDLLEAINFVVSAGKCFVVVGMDRDQVRRGILANYKSEFVDIPKEAVRGGSIQAARRRFADRYLEKLINIEVPVPEASHEQITSLLADTKKSSELPAGIEARRRLRFIYDNGPAMLTAVFLVGLFIWIYPYLKRPTLVEQDQLTLPVTSPASPQPAEQSVGFSVPQVYSSDKDLVGAKPLAGFPWAQVVIVIALLVAAGAYLARVWVLAKQRPVSDSEPFRDALKLWTRVIFYIARTPRGVKQYKNMLRYQAMRLRAPSGADEGKPGIDEADLVALGAISLVDRDLLSKANDSGKSIRLVIDGAKKTARGDRKKVLQEVAAVLDRGPTSPGQPSANLEKFIEEYLPLLPRTA